MTGSSWASPGRTTICRRDLLRAITGVAPTAAFAGDAMAIEESDRAARNPSSPVDRRSINGGEASADPTTGLAQTDSLPKESPGRTHSAVKRRRLLLGAIGALILLAALVFGVPGVQQALNTVSTDDAYVNGHVTFVAPRVRGQVLRVLVDDNNRVRKGDLLVELDKEPFRLAVAGQQAAVDTATGRPRGGDRGGARPRG